MWQTNTTPHAASTPRRTFSTVQVLPGLGPLFCDMESCLLLDVQHGDELPISVPSVQIKGTTIAIRTTAVVTSQLVTQAICSHKDSSPHQRSPPLIIVHCGKGGRRSMLSSGQHNHTTLSMSLGCCPTYFPHPSHSQAT